MKAHGKKFAEPALLRSGFLALLMSLTAMASAFVSVQTAPQASSAPDLEALLPDQFEQWTRTPIGMAVLPAEKNLKPGEAVAYRAYKDDLGRVVTLVAAYGPPHGDSVRLHRPEKCYVAQGFSINNRERANLNRGDAAIPIIHMQTESPTRKEAVSYWLRSGPEFVVAASSSQWINLRRGFARPLDGALIRVSSPGDDPSLLQVHEKFLMDFSTALTPEASEVLLGKGEEKGLSS